MTIDFVSILLFLGIGQCLFLLLIILINRKSNPLANYLLGGILFAFLWYQVEFFLLRHTLDAQIPFIYSTRYGSWLIVGPLILLYTRAILIKNYKLSRKDGLHFLPFFLFTIILPILFNDIITNRATDYGMLTVFDAWNREPITAKHYLYAYIFLLQFLHALVYLWFSYKETKKLVHSAKNYQSNIPIANLRSLQFLYVGLVLIILLCSGFVLYQFLTTMWRRTFDYFYVLPTLLLIFGIAYRTMRYPNSILLLQEEIKPTKYAKSGLTEQAKNSLLKALKKKLEVDKIYRNAELRLADLAQELNISKHHLSQVINEQLQQNFFDLINGYRIQEAQAIIQERSQKNLLEIAYQVGFNSKNSFNNAFKKNVGMTPSVYRKSV
ncbi:MAG: helix-turn-helix transcriptional regulator [Bacteroidota bacterium]